MKQVTEAWVLDEPTGGDFSKIQFKAGDKTKTGSITGTALQLIQLKAAGDEEALNALLQRAVQNFIKRNPNSDVVVIATPLELD